MIAQSVDKTQVLVESDVRLKLAHLDEAIHKMLNGRAIEVPQNPGRDVQVWPIRDLPAKKGLSTLEGRARLMHDLASIELQAMELAVRTLAEYPEAPRLFREQLAQLAREEGHHLKLCLDVLVDLEFPWGTFPTHLGLWQAVETSDSLLDRVLIVHRYLEGSGLDASDTILRRLDGVAENQVKPVVKLIRTEEADHVRFGSRWYRELAREQKLDPDQDFKLRLGRLFSRIPRRLEPISRAVRSEVGFSEKEIDALEELRLNFVNRF